MLELSGKPHHHDAVLLLRGATTALPNRWNDSLSVTVLLSTSAPGRLSGSTAKYPSRSSWNLHGSLKCQGCIGATYLT